MPWYDLVHIGLLTLIWVVIAINFWSIVSERYHWMLFFMVYTVTEIVSIPMSLYSGNNLWLYSVSRPIQFLFVLAYLLNELDFARHKRRVWVQAAAIVAILLYCSQPLNDYNSFEQVVFGAIITIACALYFKRMILSDDPVALGKTEFWYMASLFIFYGTSLTVNGSIEYLIVKDRTLATRLFYLIIIESYILYAMTSFALLSGYPLNKSRKW